ncbi:MAG: methylated-DNA--[protein]-cysteine S-methyltransferase [Bdellovibrionota bacterium]
MKHTQSVRKIASPLGELTLVAGQRGLLAIHWDCAEREYDRDYPVLLKAEQQLQEYFDGKRRHCDLPLAPEGTPFQQSVWKRLQEIPHGEMRTYGEIARAIGRPLASRAVGAAIGANPIGILIPCHRVIGSNGKLTGFAGGLAAKRYLLAHEKEGAPKLHQSAPLITSSRS